MRPTNFIFYCCISNICFGCTSYRRTVFMIWSGATACEANAGHLQVDPKRGQSREREIGKKSVLKAQEPRGGPSDSEKLGPDREGACGRMIALCGAWKLPGWKVIWFAGNTSWNVCWSTKHMIVAVPTRVAVTLQRLEPVFVTLMRRAGVNCWTYPRVIICQAR